MITGTHLLIYSADAKADRAFLRDVLAFDSVDAGDGWLIFALPPAEMGVHPMDTVPLEGPADTELHFMCKDLNSTIAQLTARGVECTDPVDESWGIRTSFRLPSGASLSLYQPKHPTALKP